MERRALVVERDARSLRERELAAVELGLACEDPSRVVLPAPFGPRARAARRARP